MNRNGILFPEWERGLNTFNNIFDEMERKFKTKILCTPQNMVNSTPNIPTFCDIIDEKDQFVILMDMPRVRIDETQICVEESVISITVEHKESDEEKARKYIQKEHENFRFSRSFELPQKIICKKVSAKLRDGMLTITVPKIKAVSKPSSQIQIK